MTPVINTKPEIATRAVYWIAEGIKRRRMGHKMCLVDDPKTFMFGWKDCTTGKVMKMPFLKFVNQRDEITQVFGKSVLRKLGREEGRREIFGC